MVEAAGIEPLFPLNLNPMMANDFRLLPLREYRVILRSFVPWSPPESPAIHPSHGDILETHRDLLERANLLNSVFMIYHAAPFPSREAW